MRASRDPRFVCSTGPRALNAKRPRLDGRPGWYWTPHDSAWEEGFAHLLVYAQANGHARVPRRYRTPGGFNLGQWAGVHRSGRHDMSDARKARLEAVPGWAWSTREAEWQGRFALLLEYVQREGSANVPVKHQTSDGFGLGLWVYRQRASREKLSEDQRLLLEELPGWEW